MHYQQKGRKVKYVSQLMRYKVENDCELLDISAKSVGV